MKDGSSSSHSSPVSAAGSLNAAQVPSEVYELLKQQDSQLKQLREQLQQLLSKQSQAEGNSPLTQGTLKEVMSTATQMSATASPVKKGKAMCEMAVNTSLFWPQQGGNGHNVTVNSNAAQTSQDKAQVFDQSQSTSNAHLNESSSATNTLNHSQRSQNTTQPFTQFVHPATPNQSQRSTKNPNSAMNDSKHDRSQQHTPQNLTPPRPPSANQSPCHGMNDAINQALSNDTCSLSELQLGNLHDRTEDSYMSMVVDMPGCPSLSPEK